MFPIHVCIFPNPSIASAIRTTFRDSARASTIPFGRVVGSSAYEVAVENGFVGTEEDWLNSLTGSSGQDGREIELKMNGTMLQWKYSGEEDSSYRDLSDLSSIIVNTNIDWIEK